MSETLYLVTGAAGFLGSHVCHQLLEHGEKVRAFVLDGDPAIKYIPKEAEIVKGDLCDNRFTRKLFQSTGRAQRQSCSMWQAWSVSILILTRNLWM